MRLHRIRLTNVRGVVERSIELPDRGVTVVEGPNEIGKTTTAEAVDVLFEAKDSSKAHQVRELHAAGSDAGPRVEVEFSTAQCRGTYVKQWGRGRMTRLTLTSPRRQQLSGDEAHSRARKLLDADVDPALWRALKIVQGESLTPAAWQQVPSLGQALDRAAAAAEQATSTDCSEPEDLFARVNEEAARFFTARTGQPTGQLVQATQTYERALADVAELHSQQRQAQADVDDAARCAQALAALGEREGQLSDELKQARDDAARLTGLREALRRAAADREVVAAEVAATEREWHQRQAEVVDVAVRSAAIKSLRPRVEDCVASDQAATVRRHAATEQLAAARRTRDRSRQHADAVQQQLALAHLRHELTVLGDRLTSAQRELAAVADATAALDSFRIDDALLRRIEQASNALSQAELSQDLAASVLTVVRLGTREVRLDGVRLDTANGTATDGGAGHAASVRVTEERSIEVPDVVRVSVRPGSSDADLAAKVELARSTLAELLGAAGVADVDEARAAVEHRRAAQRERDLADAAVRHHLGGETEERLRERVASLRDRLAPEKQVPAGWRRSDEPLTTTASLSTEPLGDLDRASAEAARALEVAERQLSRAEHTRDGLLEEHAAAHRQLASLQEQLSAQEVEHRRLTERLAQARAERGDETLDAAVRDAKGRLTELEGHLAERRHQVDAADPAEIELRLSRAEDLEEQLEGERRHVQSIADQVRGRLLLVEKAGLFDRLEEAEGVLDSARRELLSVQRRARAARLLASSMAARRDEARSRYIAPYSSAIQRLGRCVFGDDFDVEVDADLRVVKRTLNGHTLPVSSLSGGSREQLSLVERLACAELVGPEAEVPVVIDDALGFSDPQRLQAMGALLSVAGQHSQVIVLTCQPERYRHVSDATVIRLRA
ncbi:MAG: DNA double-strand break repair Rad50 ATPase [uncultured Nocardioidaceae bacterium]|uniref:DNA double-strand break repair Rad50 ATPase n=1 Tax=uncultured Nocardioidaceae bacterium TaxID=253824 RepID=A0A6J4N3D4_9ACTN|nr:MAG: DNA double-strand break repair Rad50 ATPase [uncultured Nocardioidaceae bacterium]